MKTWFASLIAAVALNSASAQWLHPEAVQFGVFGALIGGAVGGDRHCGYRSWNGENAAIGAGAGLLFGTLLGETRRQQYQSAAYAYPSSPYGYNQGYNEAPVRYSPARPNYAVGGTLLGAASGALIGEGTSGKPGRGAAIGAAAGLVLGSLAEHDARQREAAMTATYAPPTLTARSSVWQSAPPSPYQIPDAPRVPDAPTF